MSCRLIVPLGGLAVTNALTKRYMAGYLFYIWGYADSCAIGE
ncbi:hypothetical protein MADA3029_240014 [Vibrio nigripulchritudo MADA3029]|nr:hypothetical protein VIBNIMADA3020_370015 [Vibrio nigripulchritudo MADA3020]CCN53614.1 hypothetical protein VIBNIMADA3021_340026 [Vibrio nigripulchritudo MADA3021]CCN58695.1 hypothetical protein MADA3029_240014 [Vibrio nigripulchritudo MADA3029]